MKDFYLRMRFEIIKREGPNGMIEVRGWTERVIRTRAETLLAASMDADHIAHGYTLGTGLRAECDAVRTTPFKGATPLETDRDFAGAFPLGSNDNG